MSKVIVQMPGSAPKTPPAPPAPQARISTDSTYGKGLEYVNDTAKVVKNVSQMATNPLDTLYSMLSVLIILGMIIGLLWLARKVMGNTLSNIWSKIIEPFEGLAARLSAEKSTGEKATQSSSDLKDLTEAIASCFRRRGDDEESLYIYLNQIDSNNSWEMVKKFYGQRSCPKLLVSETHDLEGMMRCNLTSQECEKCIAILLSKGVPRSNIKLN